MSPLLLRSLKLASLRLIPGGASRMPPPAANAWVFELPLEDPSAAARILDTRLSEVLARRLPPARLAAELAMLQQASLPLAALVEAALPRATLNIDARCLEAVVLMLTLFKRLSIAFEQIAMQSARPRRLRRANPALELALQHGSQATARRLELAQRVYARGSPRCWAQLRRFSELAGAPRLRLSDACRLSVENLHVRALLFALLDPGRLDPPRFEQFRLYLQRHGKLARLTPSAAVAASAESPVGVFALNHEGRPIAAHWPSQLASLQATGLWLDARPLLERLRRQLDGLAQKADPASLGLPAEAHEAGYREMLQHALERWSGSASRRHARSRFQPRVRLVAGHADMLSVLGAQSATARGDTPGAERRPDGLWSIVDESANGLALSHVAGALDHIRPGQPCLIEQEGRGKLHLGCIRRAESHCPGQLRIGVELLAGEAQGVDILAPGAPAAILLERVPMLAGRPGLLCARGELQAGALAVLAGRQAATPYRLTSCHRWHEALDLFALAPES